MSAPSHTPDTDVVDLRSDTVTRPTAAMYEAMVRAPVGDDGRGEDPTVRALEQRIAQMLGCEAAVFLASGTQANLCAILAHCTRGDEYIVGQYAHCYRWEGGGAAVLGGVQPQPIEHEADGTLPLPRIAEAIKPADAHFAVSRLLALENTWNGLCLPQPYLEAASELARGRGLATHLDGARLFNAAVAQAGDVPHASRIAQEARRIAAPFDSVSVCFSKGLGAPAGSALCGSTALVARARRLRLMLGGTMRQAGVLAAAALHALDHHLPRLAEDHRLARRLHQGLQGLPGMQVDLPMTNMVNVRWTAAVAAGHTTAFLRHLAGHGVLATGQYQLRLVTHRDVDDAGVERAIDAVRSAIA